VLGGRTLSDVVMNAIALVTMTWSASPSASPSTRASSRRRRYALVFLFGYAMSWVYSYIG